MTDLTPCFATACDNIQEDTNRDDLYLIPPRGDERNFLKGEDNKSYESGTVKRWPESGPDSAKTPKINPDLQRIITAWPKLSEKVKAKVLDIIEAAKNEG